MSERRARPHLVPPGHFQGETSQHLASWLEARRGCCQLQYRSRRNHRRAGRLRAAMAVITPLHVCHQHIVLHFRNACHQPFHRCACQCMLRSLPSAHTCPHRHASVHRCACQCMLRSMLIAPTILQPRQSGWISCFILDAKESDVTGQMLGLNYDKLHHHTQGAGSALPLEATPTPHTHAHGMPARYVRLNHAGGIARHHCEPCDRKARESTQKMVMLRVSCTVSFRSCDQQHELQVFQCIWGHLVLSLTFTLAQLGTLHPSAQTGVPHRSPRLAPGWTIVAGVRESNP